MAEIAGQSPLERAAQAIRITLHLATNSEREAADRAARAALEAMREPSEAMVLAGAGYQFAPTGLAELYGDDFDPVARREAMLATERWQAMIDAALAE